MMKNLYFYLVLCFGCGTYQESNLGVEKFTGVDLGGNFIELSKLSTPRIAINVYSPTCIPCYKEIPTLNHLYEEMEKTGQGKFFLVVDPITVVEDGEGLSSEDREKKSIQIMQEEVKKRGIKPPVLVMKPEFRVTPGTGLITGTPETLIFRTGPLRLYYNFIGSISEKQTEEEILNDSKVKFFKKVLGGM
jgi:thiol-disulfide isomerase/thioredoxin